MIFTETKLKGAFVIDIERREDNRGFFTRAFCQREFADHGLKPVIAQANIEMDQEQLRSAFYTPEEAAAQIDQAAVRFGAEGKRLVAALDAYIAGINGATSGSGVAVYINANGQLGTITSSRRRTLETLAAVPSPLVGRLASEQRASRGCAQNGNRLRLCPLWDQ